MIINNKMVKSVNDFDFSIFNLESGENVIFLIFFAEYKLLLELISNKNCKNDVRVHSLHFFRQLAHTFYFSKFSRFFNGFFWRGGGKLARFSGQ